MNTLSLAGTMITHPSAAFVELRERRRFWLPLIALVVGLALQQYWYFTIVDIEWLKDRMYSGAEMTPEQRQAMMGMMSRNVMLWSSVGSVALIMPLMMALSAVYYLLAGKVTNVQYSFKQWFSFCVWCSVPVIIGLIASYGILLVQDANAQIGPSELSVFSANELFQLPPSDSGAQLLTQLNPITLWTWAISIIGIKTWSNRSWLFSTVVAMLPAVIIYGIWALIAF